MTTNVLGIIEQRHLLERALHARNVKATIKARSCVACKAPTDVYQMSIDERDMWLKTGVCGVCQYPIESLRVPTSDGVGVPLNECRMKTNMTKQGDLGYVMEHHVLYAEGWNFVCASIVDKKTQLLAIHMYVCERAHRAEKTGGKEALIIRNHLLSDFTRATAESYHIVNETHEDISFTGNSTKLD